MKSDDHRLGLARLRLIDCCPNQLLMSQMHAIKCTNGADRRDVSSALLEGVMNLHATCIRPQTLLPVSRLDQTFVQSP